jgi:hypothetical protein
VEATWRNGTVPVNLELGLEGVTVTLTSERCLQEAPSCLQYCRCRDDI